MDRRTARKERAKAEGRARRRRDKRPMGKTETRLLAAMLAAGRLCVQFSTGAGCRKGGEGSRDFEAAERLVRRGLAREVSREGSSLYVRPGRSCRVVDLVIEPVHKPGPCDACGSNACEPDETICPACKVKPCKACKHETPHHQCTTGDPGCMHCDVCGDGEGPSH